MRDAAVIAGVLAAVAVAPVVAQTHPRYGPVTCVYDQLTEAQRKDLLRMRRYPQKQLEASAGDRMVARAEGKCAAEHGYTPRGAELARSHTLMRFMRLDAEDRYVTGKSKLEDLDQIWDSIPVAQLETSFRQGALNPAVTRHITSKLEEAKSPRASMGFEALRFRFHMTLFERAWMEQP